MEETGGPEAPRTQAQTSSQPSAGHSAMLLLPKTFTPQAGPTQPCEDLQAASKGFVKEEREPNSDYEWNPTTIHI